MTPDEIRAWREERGMSQTDLADALSVDGRLAPPTVSRWESGDRKPPPFLRLALKALRVRRKP
jgi:transcriptional regulator with XRE-family HTH domain